MESINPQDRSRNQSRETENENHASIDSPIVFNVTSESLETVPEVQVPSCDGSDVMKTNKVDSISSKKLAQKKTPKKVILIHYCAKVTKLKLLTVLTGSPASLIDSS